MRTERGLDRLVTLLDAIVAIAITLLVLPLVDLLGGERRDGLADLLGDHVADFGAFALSFVVIARLWLVHHRIVESVGAYDGAFVAVNLVWAFAIVLLPFSSQVAADYGGERLAVAIYIGTVVLASASATVLVLLLRRRPALLRRGTAASELDLPAALATLALLVAALVLGVAVRPVNFYALLLLFLSGPAERVTRRLLQRR